VGKESEGVTREQAEAYVEKLKTDGRTSRLKLPKGRKLPLTFAQATKQYLERLETTEGKNLKGKRQQLRDRLIPFFGKNPLETIATFDVERFKRQCLDDGLTKSTINRYLATFSHVINKSLEWGWLDKKPCVITKHKEPPGRLEYLTGAEVQSLLAAAKAYPEPYIWLFVTIGLETSMRMTEILCIRLTDIYYDRGYIHIPKAKAGERNQPLSRRLAGVLKDYIQVWGEPGQVWLFPSRTSATGHMVTLRKSFRDVVKAAGLDVDRVVRHTLRHTAITHLVQSGVDLMTVKKISGHKTFQMVERYTHANRDHLQLALDKLGERYGLEN
jgi:integrase